MMDVEMDVDRKQDKELLREGVHKLLDTMTEEEVEELIPYLFWILETPYS